MAAADSRLATAEAAVVAANVRVAKAEAAAVSADERATAAEGRAEQATAAAHAKTEASESMAEATTAPLIVSPFNGVVIEFDASRRTVSSRLVALSSLSRRAPTVVDARRDASSSTDASPSLSSWDPRGCTGRVGVSLHLRVMTGGCLHMGGGDGVASPVTDDADDFQNTTPCMGVSR